MLGGKLSVFSKSRVLNAVFPVSPLPGYWAPAGGNSEADCGEFLNNQSCITVDGDGSGILRKRIR
jgi:hypothetical protein